MELALAGIANPNNTDNGTSNAVNVNYTTGGLAKMESSPLFFARFGHVYDSTLYYVAYNGFYWSGSAVSSASAYYLYYVSGVLYPAGQYNRFYGRSVRCLAR